MTIRFFAFATLFFLIACDGSSKVTDEIEGKYKFKYPSGQVEILEMKPHRSYSRKIYANESDYSNGLKPLYNDNGYWYNNDKELNFERWLNYCYMGRDIDSILPEPHYGTMLNVYYHGPKSYSYGQIDIYLENGYVFEKIE